MASENPYQAPELPSGLSEPMVGTLPAKVIKQANGLIRDSRLWIAVVLIPILALLMLLRLAQWDRLRRQYPDLVADDAGGPRGLAKDFRAAGPRLWIGVLLWPVLILVVAILGGLSR